MIIEKGIPIPKSRSARESKYSKAIDEMEPGDSYKFYTIGFANAFVAAMKKRGLNPVLRKVRIKGEIFWRVWQDAMSDED